MKFQYRTRNTCSSVISFDIQNGIVTHVTFTGGCNGNLKAVSALVDEMTVEEIEKKCKGITCGRRPTSCPDQLALAVRKALEAERKSNA